MERDYDLIIIGGGAAGLSAAQYGARANLKTVLVEEMAPGGQALLIDGLENYPGYAKPISGFEFASAMQEQAENFGAAFVTASVTAVTRDGKGFSVETTEGGLSAPALILATGSRHRHIGAPGEERLAGRGVSYCATCDGPFFKGKKILVVGGGDAACDEAMFLAKLSPTVVMVHRRERFRAQRSLASRVLAEPSIDVRFGTIVEEIRGEKKVESVLLRRTDSDVSYEETMDAVFVFVGSDPQTALVPEAAKDESGSIITDERMATNIPGLFAAGDVRVSPFRQIVTACSDGAIAAHSAAQYIDDLRGEAYR